MHGQIMAGAQPQMVDTLVVSKGRIVLAGSRATARKHAGPTTRQIDLQGKTLLPGFVDGHSHFSGVGLQAVSANLLPPPDGGVGSIAALQQAMRDFIASSPTRVATWRSSTARRWPRPASRLPRPTRAAA
jgi:predicted amidohydrolase YtcJ